MHVPEPSKPSLDSTPAEPGGDRLLLVPRGLLWFVIADAVAAEGKIAAWRRKLR